MPCRIILPCLIGLLLVTGCDSEPQQQQPSPPPVTDLFTPVRVSVVQRTFEPIPGMGNRLHLHIDDITAGHVLVKVTTTQGVAVLPNTAIKEGQALAFKYEDQDYSLRLVELFNFLTGDDYGVFEVSKADAPDAANAETTPLTEQQKIEGLIQAVESLQDAAFIRNGKEHTPAEAAKHMRDKWQWKTGEINTAEDFIRVAASHSSITGEAYLIRFSDGREVTSEAYLQEALGQMP